MMGLLPPLPLRGLFVVALLTEKRVQPLLSSYQDQHHHHHHPHPANKGNKSNATMMSSPREDILLSRNGDHRPEENRGFDGNGQIVALSGENGISSSLGFSVSFDLPIQKESGVAGTVDFQTPPPRSKNRDHPLPQEDALVGAEWQMEISPISQSRGSDVGGSTMFPVSYSSPFGLPDDAPHDLQIDTNNAMTSSLDVELFGKVDSTIPNTEIKESDESQEWPRFGATSGNYICGVSTPPPTNNLLSPKTLDGSVLPQHSDQSAVGSNTFASSSERQSEERNRDPLERKHDDFPTDQLKNLISKDQNPQNTDTTNFMASDTSNANGDLSSARKQVDESSLEFIERIRNAAHRRKVAMTRSRDSLAAKEREQLLSIAASKEKSSESVTIAMISEKIPRHAPPQSTERKPFKARPLPSTTFADGMGGLAGVPKVSTKPTTTPFSPLLGKRRKEPIRISALEPPKNAITGIDCIKNKATSSRERKDDPHSLPSSTQEPALAPFKARPLPTSTGLKGHGGQTGVPKVPKRPVTVPFSPNLGPRRRNLPSKQSMTKKLSKQDKFAETSDPLAGSETCNGSGCISYHSAPRQKVPSSTPSTRKCPPSGSKFASPVSQSSPLIGLGLLESTPEPTYPWMKEGSENTTPRNATVRAYEPHSTARAKKRAEFDVKRDKIAQKKLEEGRKIQEVRIRVLHKELRELRKDLGN